jgi:hypothetical protein
VAGRVIAPGFFFFLRICYLQGGNLPRSELRPKGELVGATEPKMSTFEIGECFRSFLLLIGYDGVISDEEKRLLRGIGRRLGFNSEFCEAAMEELLGNRYIVREPPSFSRKEYAESFLYDAYRIAVADGELHPKEIEWLQRIAEKNEVDSTWVEGLTTMLLKGKVSPSLDDHLALEDYLG